ncbi:hypothetical protein ABFS83_09G111300 [Erythranthe nasuta]
MSGEGPKLFNNKPKKSKWKASEPITMASSSSTGAVAPPPPPSPPPLPQKESLLRRYRFLVPLILVCNFAVGAYVVVRYTMKDKTKSEEEEETSVGPTISSSTSATISDTSKIIEKPITLPIVEPIKRAPIPVDNQRELFKWMLEEKRKVKPIDAEEKKRIDEEKAILKQFIRANSIPTIS